MKAHRFRLRAPVPYEAQIQSAFFDWVRNYGVREFPELKWMHAIPNGGARDPITGANLKRQGVRKGILDTCLPVARKGFHGIYVEFKRPGEKPTKEQWEFSEFLTAQGYAAYCVSDWQVAINIVREYLSDASSARQSDPNPGAGVPLAEVSRALPVGLIEADVA